jgi:hypothetical protein
MKAAIFEYLYDRMGYRRALTIWSRFIAIKMAAARMLTPEFTGALLKNDQFPKGGAGPAHRVAPGCPDPIH